MNLRTRLFLSVGLLLFILAIINFLLPDYLVKKDIDKTAKSINSVIEEKEKQIANALSLLLEQKFNDLSVNLTAISTLISESKLFQEELKGAKGKDFYRIASQWLPYSPHFAFIQMRDASTGEIFSIAPVHISATPFQLLSQKEGPFYVALCPPSDSFYTARPLSQNSYLLFQENVLPKRYKELQCSDLSNLDGHLLEALNFQEKQWLSRLALIQGFIAWYTTANASSADGYLQTDPGNENGQLLFTKDFLSPIEVEKTSHLISQEKGSGNLFLKKTLTIEGISLEVGFLLSDILRSIAFATERDVLFFAGNTIQVGYTKEGLFFDPFQIKYEEYNAQRFDIDSDWQSTFFILTPIGSTSSIFAILETMRQGMVSKISLNLLGASLFCFAIALLFLGRISKKVIEPVVILAKATEELEKGNYDGLELPRLEKRKDEIAVLATGFEKMVFSLKDREKIRGILNKVVSKEIASEILKGSIELGGEERTVTMLFSDVRGFTKMTENVPPHTLINRMNTYLTEMCRIIDMNKGVVDKFVGDEIMALYGAPLNSESQAVHAITSALQMIEQLKQSNEKRANEQLPLIEVGFGIHTGLVVAGNVGSENRLNYTVLGANVNLASRLCSVAKGMQILISEATLLSPAVQTTFIYEEMSTIPLKGISKPVRIFEIKGFFN